MPELPSSPAAKAAPLAGGVPVVGAGVELDLGLAPDAAEIARIVGRDDPVRRNLEITLGYYRLSHALRRHLGPENANWCTFGTWASRRAGQTIRGEDLGKLRERLRRRLVGDDALDRALHHVNAGLPRHRLPIVIDKRRVAARVLAVVDDVGTYVADGNRIVFGEMAPPFAELLARFGGASRLDADELRSFLARFAPGPIEAEGQDLLRSAFAGYAHALFESDAKAKAELILLANDQIGLHEQTRVQPEIAAALTAPIEHLGDWLTDDLRSKLPLQGRPRRLSKVELLAPLLAVVGPIWREEATDYLTTLPVPGEVLKLGRDVPSLPGQPMFPLPLQQLRNADLVLFLRQHDRTPDTTAGSAATDWSRLADRVHFIMDFFRARQQQPTLYWAPFTVEQCRAILDGRIPAGPL